MSNEIIKIFPELTEKHFFIDQKTHEYWFQASRACEIIEYKRIDYAVKTYTEPNERKKIKVKGRDTWFISESGFFGILINTQNSKSKEFQAWLKQAVLPELRTANAYIHPAASKEQLQEVSRVVNARLDSYVQTAYENILDDLFSLLMQPRKKQEQINCEPVQSEIFEKVEGNDRWIYDRSLCLELGFNEAFLSNNRMAALRKALRKLESKKIGNKVYYRHTETLEKIIKESFDKEFDNWRKRRTVVTVNQEVDPRELDPNTNCKKIKFEVIG